MRLLISFPLLVLLQLGATPAMGAGVNSENYCGRPVKALSWSIDKLLSAAVESNINAPGLTNAKLQSFMKQSGGFVVRFPERRVKFSHVARFYGYVEGSMPVFGIAVPDKNIYHDGFARAFLLVERANSHHQVWHSFQRSEGVNGC